MTKKTPMPKDSWREKKQLEFTFPFLVWNSETINFPPHWHDCFEMIFVWKGHIYASLDDIVYEVNEGDFILVNAGTVHGYFNQKPNTFIQGLQFDITFFDEGFSELRDLIFRNPLLEKRAMPDELYRRFRNLLEGIALEYHEKSLGYQVAVKSKFYELLLIILRDMGKAGSENRPKPGPAEQNTDEAGKSLNRSIKSIVAFIFRNFDDPDLCLEEMADVLHLNKYYFTRFFKKHTGQSFHAYLTKIRVEFAKHYLIETGMSITDAAFRAGFGSLQTFNRVFKTFTSRTPRDWRSENRPFSPSMMPSQFAAPPQFSFEKKNYPGTSV
jgi:AraC-like DNA-binding protein